MHHGWRNRVTHVHDLPILVDTDSEEDARHYEQSKGYIDTVVGSLVILLKIEPGLQTSVPTTEE